MKLLLDMDPSKKEDNPILTNIHDFFCLNFKNIVFLAVINSILYFLCYYFSLINLPIYRIISRVFINFFICFFIITFFYLLINFLPNAIKKLISFIFIFFTCLIFIIELFLFYHFKSLISVSFVQIFFETNAEESKDFLSIYLTLKVIIGMLFVIIATSVAAFIAQKYTYIDSFKKKFLLCFILLISSIFFLRSFFRDRKTETVSKLEIPRIYYATRKAIENIRDYSMIEKNFKSNNKTTIIDNQSRIKNIIFIIGESASRNHMSIYGYSKKTNPLLTKLENNKNLYKYSDVISPHGSTLPSLQTVLTFRDYENPDEWWKYDNIIDIFKLAGYKTFWYSNQDSLGVMGSTAAIIGKQADFALFNNIKAFDDKDPVPSYDEQIVKKLKDTFPKNKGDKNFIVIHLMGNHASYNKRYPKDSKYATTFSSDMYSENNLGEMENNRIAEYDNAMLYNDHILDDIMNYFAKDESIVFYLSDHGENVYDYDNQIGHSDTLDVQNIFQIPFLIFISNQLKNLQPDLATKIEKSLDKPYMTDDFINTLLDIAQIKTKDFDKTRSIINKEFNTKRKRLINEKDYDNNFNKN